MRGLVRELSYRRLALLVLLVAPGCAIEHPGLTASSGSGMPWFNFQLAPQKKDQKNYPRSIARDSATKVELKHAMLTPSDTPRRWPDIRVPGWKGESLTLPRTDGELRIDDDAPKTMTQVEQIEFD